MADYRDSLRAIVEYHCQRKGIPMRELASDAGISPQQLSNVLKGSEHFSFPKFLSLLKAMRMGIQIVPLPKKAPTPEIERLRTK